MKRTREQSRHHEVPTDYRMGMPRNLTSRRIAPTTSSCSFPGDSSDVSTQLLQTSEVVLEERERREIERRIRMERLRAENEAEEKIAIARRSSTAPDQPPEVRKITEEELRGLDDEEQMRLFMGFGDFNTTKGKAVKDNHTTSARGAVAKNKARKYRQYMNRKGGFNRPLDNLP
jgi:U4/U6.U5 tri-snRNP-associated protein 3